MANTVKINVGSLGCLGGGEGNLRDTSIHDSTCSCEGCLEKKFAAREFLIDTSKVFGAKDYGFNDGDEENLFNETGEVIVLSDDDESSDDCSSSSSSDDDRGSVSDIFDIYDDEPSYDAGYYDDGKDSEDAYSVCSPKPYTNTITNSIEEGNSESDIEEEDTPPIAPSSIEDAINDASAETSARDGRLVDECVTEINNMDHFTVQMKELDKYMDSNRLNAAQFWRGQILKYESKITSLFKDLSKYADGILAAKRRIDYDAHEIARLRELAMTKTKESNDKDKEIYKMAKDMGRQALRHSNELEKQRDTISTFKKRLQDERKKSATLEKELEFTRKRLLTHTRRSVPRRCKRVRRRIDYDDESSITAGSNSDTDYETEEHTNTMLINLMDTSDA